MTTYRSDHIIASFEGNVRMHEDSQNCESLSQHGQPVCSAVNRCLAMGRRTAKHLASNGNAKKARRSLKNSKVERGHVGKFGVSSNSPILKINDFKRTPAKTVAYDPQETIRMKKSTPVVPRTPVKDLQSVAELKYQAVFQYEKEKSANNNRLSNERTDDIAKEYAMTGRYLRSLAKQIGARSFNRKPGTGQLQTVANRKDIVEFMEPKAKEWDYEFNQRAMAEAVREKFEVGCLSTVQKMMHLEEWTKSKNYIKPFLAEKHELARLQWAQERKDFDFFSTEKVVVHIDEKYFYALRNQKIIYYPKGCEPPTTTALSKTQIPKVMFFGAVAPPNVSKKFDGRIGLWLVSETKVAERNSKFHDRGDEYEVPTMMNGELFVRLCKDNLIPAMVEKLKWAKKIEVQMDSAGGHKIKSSVNELNTYCQSMFKKISFVTQPTRSPDLNVLDLGIWNSLQSGVPTIKYDKAAEEPMNQRIIEKVEHMWDNYDGFAKLTKIFRTLTLIYNAVIKAEGRNDFKLPHSRDELK
jgi:hypothetical protein